MPIVKIDTNNAQINTVSNSYIVAVDDDSVTDLDPNATVGILNGVSPFTGKYIRVEQGLDTTEISSTFTIDSDLKETQYLIEIDNRFGSIYSTDDSTAASLSYIDDDNIASYYISDSDNKFVGNITDTTSGGSVIAGPRGTYLKFKIRSSIELNSSSFLFTQLGTSSVPGTDIASTGSGTYYVINTIIRITGVTTGYSINIPVKFVKKQT